MNDQAHSILGASSMYRWSACPGSVRECRDIPNPSSKYADEGNRAHELAAAMLLGQPPPFEPEPEMLTAVQVYIDTVMNDYLYRHVGRKNTPNGVLLSLPSGTEDRLFIEHRFDLSSIHRGCFGTADAVTWHPIPKMLTVYDYKHGAGHIVEVENNSQLMYYALGALVTLGFPAETVEIVVVQPRAKHKKGVVRRWRLTPYDLLDFAGDLVIAAKRTEELDAPLNEGKWCWFCPARLQGCPLKSKAALAKAVEEFSDLDEENPFEEDLFS